MKFIYAPDIHLDSPLHGLSAYSDAPAAQLRIGVLHTALEGGTVHANYAPCSRAELHAKGYDYWALGHVHEFQHWEGPSRIVFPGNLQGRHIRRPDAAAPCS